MKNRTVIRHSVSVFALVLGATTAEAQTAPMAAAETDDANAIIVTARRINERLQDVPAAISVVVNSSTNAARSRFARNVAHGNTSAIVSSSPVGPCVTRFRSSRASASNASERSSSRSASLSLNDGALRRRSSTSWSESSATTSFG
jgi:hypothetical protein